MAKNNEKSRPAYNQSYEIIRDMILQGDIPRGTKIVEEKLASELGVSRTPIRESIRKLEQEGLIANKMVINPSEKDLRNTFQVRMLLEGHSAGMLRLIFPKASLTLFLNVSELAERDTGRNYEGQREISRDHRTGKQ